VDGVYSLQYSFDGKFLAIGCGNGTIRVSKKGRFSSSPISYFPCHKSYWFIA